MTTYWLHSCLVIIVCFDRKRGGGGGEGGRVFFAIDVGHIHCSDHFKNKGAFITFTKALKPAFTTFDAVVCVMLWGVWYVVH